MCYLHNVLKYLVNCSQAASKSKAHGSVIIFRVMYLSSFYIVEYMTYISLLFFLFYSFYTSNKNQMEDMD
jgi:hypothetical protein